MKKSYFSFIVASTFTLSFTGCISSMNKLVSTDEKKERVELKKDREIDYRDNKYSSQNSFKPKTQVIQNREYNQSYVVPNITTKKIELLQLDSLQNSNTKDAVSTISQRLDVLEKSLLEEKIIRDNLGKELYGNNQIMKGEIAEIKHNNELLSYRVNEIIVSLNKLIENSKVNSSFKDSVNEAKIKDYEQLIQELSNHNRVIYDKLYILEKRLSILER